MKYSRRIDGTAMTSRMITGTVVQTTSSKVLCEVFDGVGLRLRLNLTMTYSKRPLTNTAMAMMITNNSVLKLCA